MSFSDFHGNAEIVHTVREMLTRDRFPHGVIVAGPAGSGKYTLATMIARAMNCLDPPAVDGFADFFVVYKSFNDGLSIARIKTFSMWKNEVDPFGRPVMHSPTSSRTSVVTEDN